MFCTHCGAQVADQAVICIGCGCALQQNKPTEYSGVQSDVPYALPAVIVGSLSALLCWIPLLGLLAGVAGAVLSTKGLTAYKKERNRYTNNMLSTIGLVGSVLAIVVGGLIFLFWVAWMIMWGEFTLAWWDLMD